MTLEITVGLEDSDLEYFRARFREARARVGTMAQQELIQRTDELVKKGLASSPPEFVRKRLTALSTVVTMVEDETWRLPSEERDRIMEVLTYFVEPSDTIPDDVPVFGFIDDAIAIDLVLGALRPEIEAYEEFLSYRSAETRRRTELGQPTDISKTDWLADRRATLQSRMSERRAQEPSGWRYMVFDDVC